MAFCGHVSAVGARVGVWDALLVTSLVCVSVVAGNSFALSGGAGRAADAVACMPASVFFGLLAMGWGTGFGGLAIAVEGGFSVGVLSSLTVSAEMTRVCKGPV